MNKQSNKRIIWAFPLVLAVILVGVTAVFLRKLHTEKIPQKNLQKVRKENED